MEYGECNHDIELLKKRKHLAASDGIEKYKWKIHYFQKDIIKIQEHNARRKKSKKEIEKIIKNNRKKIYGCCNGIRKLLASQDVIQLFLTLLFIVCVTIYVVMMVMKMML